MSSGAGASLGRPLPPRSLRLLLNLLLALLHLCLQLLQLACELLQLALQLLLLHHGRIALLHCRCLGRPGSSSLLLGVGQLCLQRRRVRLCCCQLLGELLPRLLLQRPALILVCLRAAAVDSSR